MTYPELSRGDKGDHVRSLQTYLNRVGAMLFADGDLAVLQNVVFDMLRILPISKIQEQRRVSSGHGLI